MLSVALLAGLETELGRRGAAPGAEGLGLDLTRDKPLRNVVDEARWY